MTQPDPDTVAHEKPYLQFLEAVQNRIPALDEADQELLNRISNYVDMTKWIAVDFSYAAQMFDDYRTCLRLMGKDAKVVGYRIAVCLRLFLEPRHMMEVGYMMEVLKDVSKLHQPAMTMCWPPIAGRWW